MHQEIAKPLFLSEELGSVSTLSILPPKAEVILVLSHGVGAGMQHVFMADIAQALAQQNIATMRYQFHYMEIGKKVPDRPKKALPVVEAAYQKAKEEYQLPILLAGKSFGGRMSSHLAASATLDIQGLVYFGFPLHAPGKEGTERAAHLKAITQPQLFLQGTRDTLAKVDLITQVCKDLPKATLRFIEGGDHSFKVLKKLGKSREEILNTLAMEVKVWWDQIKS